MQAEAYSDKISDYLKADEVIDYEDEGIMRLADSLYGKSRNETEYIRNAYEFVRDRISHSADICAEEVTCSASEVLRKGHGICFAKSHLLAALLRSKEIPAGFCYQKLILEDDLAPELIMHGLNGVYLRETGKWIRLDARGNKEGVCALFSTEQEHLAFPVRPEKGERDGFTVYPDPDAYVVHVLKKYSNVDALWENLPDHLSADSAAAE